VLLRALTKEVLAGLEGGEGRIYHSKKTRPLTDGEGIKNVVD
jgi:hypothetical protein